MDMQQQDIQFCFDIISMAPKHITVRHVFISAVTFRKRKYVTYTTEILLPI